MARLRATGAWRACSWTRWGAPGIHVLAGDARRPPLRAAFDSVLVDAPCSGLGTLGRNPDIRWKARGEDLRRHAERQAAILGAVSALVRPGGLLVYAACSLEPEENEGVVTPFLDAHPEFTPEPDMIHDCLGHVPPLMNHDYAELLTLIGRAVSATHSGEHVLALKRFSWFSIEFGLIEDAGETKVFGAGILSSTGEIPYSVLSPDVRREPFVTDTVINTDYDPSRMQDHLFIAPSLPFLRSELETLVRRFGLPVV